MRKTRSEMMAEGGAPIAEAGGSPFDEPGATEIVAPMAPMAPRETVGGTVRAAPLSQEAREKLMPAVKGYRVVSVPAGPNGSIRSVHIAGQQVTLLPGKILDERHYNLDRLRQQGVVLEEGTIGKVGMFVPPPKEKPAPATGTGSAA